MSREKNFLGKNVEYLVNILEKPEQIVLLGHNEHPGLRFRSWHGSPHLGFFLHCLGSTLGIECGATVVDNIVLSFL